MKRFGSKFRASKGSFTLEAVISLVILGMVLMALPRFNPNLDKAMVYKQASDISTTILVLGKLNDVWYMRSVLEKTNPNLHLKIEYMGRKIVVKWENPRNIVVIERPVLTEAGMQEVRFIFGY